MIPEKVRLLAVCDETLGRSASLAARLKEEVESLAIDSPNIANRIIVDNAGTKVRKRQSHKKYNGSAHPAIIEGMLHDYGASRVAPHIKNHNVRQLKKSDFTYNTIAVILNDPTYLNPEDIKNSLLVIAPRVIDISETSESFDLAISHILTQAHYLGYIIIAKLSESLIANDFELFAKFFRPITIVR